MRLRRFLGPDASQTEDLPPEVIVNDTHQLQHYTLRKHTVLSPKIDISVDAGRGLAAVVFFANIQQYASNVMLTKGSAQ